MPCGEQRPRVVKRPEASVDEYSHQIELLGSARPAVDQFGAPIAVEVVGVKDAFDTPDLDLVGGPGGEADAHDPQAGIVDALPVIRRIEPPVAVKIAAGVGDRSWHRAPT